MAQHLTADTVRGHLDGGLVSHDLDDELIFC